MRKFKLSFLSIALFSLLAFTASCGEDDEPTPNNSSPSPGTTEGYVTINGVNQTVSGSSTDSPLGYSMTPRNQNPPNSYPALSISFESKPTKDSTYTLSPDNSISLYESSDSYNDSYYAVSGGSIIVIVNGSVITASFSNVTVKNSPGDTKTVSGSITCY